MLPRSGRRPRGVRISPTKNAEGGRDGVCGLTRSRERDALGLPTGMGDVSALTAQLRELQAELVGALQAEYFCDDLAPPADALG